MARKSPSSPSSRMRSWWPRGRRAATCAPRPPGSRRSGRRPAMRRPDRDPVSHLAPPSALALPGRAPRYSPRRTASSRARNPRRSPAGARGPPGCRGPGLPGARASELMKEDQAFSCARPLGDQPLMRARPGVPRPPPPQHPLTTKLPVNAAARSRPWPRTSSMLMMASMPTAWASDMRLRRPGHSQVVQLVEAELPRLHLGHIGIGEVHRRLRVGVEATKKV